MASVNITDIGDENTVIAAGLFIALCIDGDGEECLRLATVGEPKTWTQAMLAQAAHECTSSRVRSLWEAKD